FGQLTNRKTPKHRIEQYVSVVGYKIETKRQQHTNS
ncbi:MAG: hypothetical protein ACI8W1_002302, partial [Candidatus Azotimanducaceae bacterium]